MRQGAPESFGQYLVHEVIGIGGMASVHRAERVGFSTVALKRMLPQFIEHDEAVEAFVRESRLAGLMSHSNLAKTYESGRIDDTYFIAMELITGRTLTDLAQRCSPAAPMPLDVVLNLVFQLCDALEYAHTLVDPETGEPLGIIHRDVSPSNLVITDDGVAKLIDFGVAKGAAVGMLTQGITMKGKFGYMAPEYLFGKLDSRADLFAVGIIAYELLTSVSLFTCDDDLETMTRLRDMPIVPPSHHNGMVPPEIDEVVMTALQRDPDARWQHAGELRAALKTAAAQLGIAPTRAIVVAWIDKTFGETLKFDLTPLPARAPVEDDLILVPEAPVVRIAPRLLTVDDWARDTNISKIIGADLAQAGAEPVSLGDPEPVVRAPIIEPERKPLPPPSVTVVKPRTRWGLVIALAAVVAVALALVIVLR